MLRWLLGLGLNGLFPTIPLGTLAANLIGYLVGIAMELPLTPLGMAPGLRLLQKASESDGLLRGIRSTRTQRGGSC